MRPLIQNDHPIKRILMEFNLTYKELSHLTGINYESLCRYANYKKKAGAQNCYKIIDFAKSRGMKLTLEDLISRKSAPLTQGIKSGE